MDEIDECGHSVDRPNAAESEKAVFRYITTHDAQGRSVFSDSLVEKVPTTTLPTGTVFGLCYATDVSPVQMNSDRDLQAYSQSLSAGGPGLMVPGGIVLRHVTIMPGRLSSMHRTMSLDYGVVLEGEVDLILDSGDVRQLGAGHIAVQRGTMHAWSNPSATIIAKMIFVLIASKPVEIEGKIFGEDAGDLPLKASRSNQDFID